MRIAVIASFFLYVVLFVVLQSIIGRRVGASNVRKNANAEFARLVIANIALACLIGALLTMRHEKFNDLLALRFAGFAVAALGLAMSMWAQVALGSNWAGGAAIHKHHRLVTSGPYRFVRHPMYTGMWISGVGFCLTSLNVFYGLTGLLWALSFSVRIPYEENLLRQKFRRRFDDYAGQTGALVPRLRRKS